MSPSLTMFAVTFAVVVVLVVVVDDADISWWFCHLSCILFVQEVVELRSSAARARRMLGIRYRGIPVFVVKSPCCRLPVV